MKQPYRTDLSADRLYSWCVHTIIGHRHGADNATDSYMRNHYRSVLVGAKTILQLAHKERAGEEERTARDMIDDGEARMCDGPAPAYWDAAGPCCKNAYADHIRYVAGPFDHMILCPAGRGYWQLARILLADDKARLARIARRAAMDVAPKWDHTARTASAR